MSPTPPVPRCAAMSLERGEAQLATASRVARWLLVEHPGPWSAESVPRSRLGGDRTDRLVQHARRLNARLVLIRRPGRADPQDAGARTVIFADSRPDHLRLLATTVPSVADLDDLRLASGWAPYPGPVFLACTHGAHDTCCALQGRPAAAALAAVAPGNTWECTHIGGDRFAGNVLVLPTGVYYGRVRPGDAAEVVDATRNAQVVTRLLRGRSIVAPIVQAAQHFARVAFDVAALDAFAPVRQDALEGDPDGALVVLEGSGAGDRIGVPVGRDAAPIAAVLTCHAADRRHAPVFTLRGPIVALAEG